MRLAPLLARAVFTVVNTAIVALYVLWVWKSMRPFAGEPATPIVAGAAVVSAVVFAAIHPVLAARRRAGRLAVLYLAFLAANVLLGLWVGFLNGHQNAYVMRQRETWSGFLRALVSGVPLTVFAAHFSGLPLLALLAAFHALTARWLLPAPVRAER